ncbi:response regulator [Microvirga splendida]|uniref:Response regulator n=1 Tax=Microvirga splendida TaxID=2795727 RepID=A0ABS0Y853_9HYPH|nr:response regulator [Microvirga splendida]MBJ6128476.1 response regulator [Microvirga splendida]
MAQRFRMTNQANGKPLVLVLEDEALIALNLQDELRDAGYRTAGPFTTCAAALGWLQTATPDTAILDVALKDGPCLEIALELGRREVPFLIYSGHHKDRQLLAEFDHVTWIEKPVPHSVLVQACHQLLVGCL